MDWFELETTTTMLDTYFASISNIKAEHSRKIASKDDATSSTRMLRGLLGSFESSPWSIKSAIVVVRGLWVVHGNFTVSLLVQYDTIIWPVIGANAFCILLTTDEHVILCHTTPHDPSSTWTEPAPWAVGTRLRGLSRASRRRNGAKWICAHILLGSYEYHGGCWYPIVAKYDVGGARRSQYTCSRVDGHPLVCCMRLHHCRCRCHGRCIFVWNIEQTFM